MSFSCEIIGCDGEAKIARMCVSHATKKAKEIHMPRKTEISASENKERSTICSRCKKDRPEDFSHKWGLCNACATSKNRKRRQASLGGGMKTEQPKRAYRKRIQPLDGESFKKAIENSDFKDRLAGLEKPDGRILTVDFSAFPGIYEWLQDLAKEDIRTPEMQVLFLLKNAFAQRPEAKA